MAGVLRVQELKVPPECLESPARLVPRMWLRARGGGLENSHKASRSEELVENILASVFPRWTTLGCAAVWGG
ncbi:hypothetical protein N7468_005166 [Penicillium chermesinum]|uniref:Uncharacterized protein n=1 Tax=Penicillium chermesinum TaxID=63820 RepID=A0A9W9TMR7_9EURO|nr:uncharacterized protein N7468_005166 [Penicillium chermesinum]KAJ5232210.1 hypothetical protein N7468_005166 [Penicillium chermesinum]KAJ6171872.1 hypothetical protein N7470_000939 [Penicillium chermesinum]